MGDKLTGERRLTLAFPNPISESSIISSVPTTDEWQPIAYQESVEARDEAGDLQTFRELPIEPSSAGPSLTTSIIDDAEVIASRYRIEGRIGEGGMGRVYKVTHLELGKTFALKIMRSSIGGQESARESFFREARLASTLSHPQIVSVVDYGEDPKYGAYMVMEFLSGVPLLDVVKRAGRLPVRQACELMLQVIEAIRYVHDNGIVHCDIKSENILVWADKSESSRRNQRVKLLDFGLARPQTDETSSETISGTPAYMAPERLKGAVPSPAMDIYSLGILFYELLTGAPPFSGNMHTVLTCQLTQEPTRPSLILGSKLDERIEAVLLKALAKIPEERQKNAAALLYELRTAMSMMGWIEPRRAKAPRAASRRESLAAAGFTDSPLPLAIFDANGTILACNRAFSVFVTGSVVDLDGVPVSETSLVKIHPRIVADLQIVRSTGRVKTLGLQIDQKGSRVHMLVWLTPSSDDDKSVHCAMHVVRSTRPAGSAG